MAQYQNHLTFSLVIGIAYAMCGFYLLNAYPEQALLAGILLVIAGMLPNVDAGGSAPARELASLLAAISPIALIEYLPVLKTGGVVRLALVVIICYIITRILVVRILQRVTVHRGMFHSVPAAAITSELVYLLFWDLYWKERLYLAIAAFIGFMSHLVLDGYTNLDLAGKAMGKTEKKKPALKFLANNWGSTFVLYATVFVLGWYVARGFFPKVHFVAGVQY